MGRNDYVYHGARAEEIYNFIKDYVLHKDDPKKLIEVTGFHEFVDYNNKMPDGNKIFVVIRKILRIYYDFEDKDRKHPLRLELLLQEDNGGTNGNLNMLWVLDIGYSRHPQEFPLGIPIIVDNFKYYFNAWFYELRKYPYDNWGPERDRVFDEFYTRVEHEKEMLMALGQGVSIPRLNPNSQLRHLNDDMFNVVAQKYTGDPHIALHKKRIVDP